MAPVIRVLLVALTLSLVSAMAQDNPASYQSEREFLKPLSAEKRSALMSRKALDLGIREYFALPGKIDVYEFDVSLLETPGQTITITPFNEPSIDIISHGIRPFPHAPWLGGSWSGQIVAQNSKQTYPIELSIGYWAIGPDGIIRPPDPNREITRNLLQQESYVVLEESVQRLNEKIVYAMSGTIRLPHLRRAIQITQLGDDELEYIVVYEGDIEKALYPVSDKRAVPLDETTELGRESMRRMAAYEAHVEKLKRELGIAQSLE